MRYLGVLSVLAVVGGGRRRGGIPDGHGAGGGVNLCVVELDSSYARWFLALADDARRCESEG